MKMNSKSKQIRLAAILSSFYSPFFAKNSTKSTMRIE
jgi:hypothetical protein